MQLLTKPYFLSEIDPTSIKEKNLRESLFPNMDYIRGLLEHIISNAVELAECDINQLEIVNENFELLTAVPPERSSNNIMILENVILSDVTATTVNAAHLENTQILETGKLSFQEINSVFFILFLSRSN